MLQHEMRPFLLLITSMQEIRICEQSNSLPLKDGGSCSDKK